MPNNGGRLQILESNQISFDHILSYPSEPMAGASQVKSPISEKLSNQILNFLLRDETKNPNKAWEPKKNQKIGFNWQDF